MTDPATAEPEKFVCSILINEDNCQDLDTLWTLYRQLKEQGHTVVFEDEKEWVARGRVPDCDCQMLQCRCQEARQHKPECRWRKALLAPIGFECEPHGLEECPTCDACSCKDIVP